MLRSPLLIRGPAQLPELMLLRGMYDRGCDNVYVIVTDLKRSEMDQVTEYFKYVCHNAVGGACKASVEQRINHDRACSIVY